MVEKQVTITGDPKFLPSGGARQHSPELYEGEWYEQDEKAVIRYIVTEWKRHSWGLRIVIDGVCHDIHERHIDKVTYEQ